MKEKLHLLLRLNWFKFIRYNFLCSKVKRDGGFIYPFWHSVIDIRKGAKAIIKDNIFLNMPEVKGSKEQATFVLRTNATIEVDGIVKIYSGGLVQVNEGGKLKMGSTYVNHGVTIIAANDMLLGDGLQLARNVIIFDSDFHKILNENGDQTNGPREFYIGQHVWIGANCTIMRGARIGDGAVIAAGSVVGGKIKPGTMASGNPARSYSEIIWSE